MGLPQGPPRGPVDWEKLEKLEGGPGGGAPPEITAWGGSRKNKKWSKNKSMTKAGPKRQVRGLYIYTHLAPQRQKEVLVSKESALQ